VTKKRRIIVWCNEDEHEFLYSFGSKFLLTPAASLRQLVKLLRDNGISSLDDLRRLLGQDEHVDPRRLN
jgi:hypothetical protein